ncbi:MAG: DUF1761 domain-containing protein [Candidatus Kerfeldbacteria bacterium]|nr:DUF1761 domain-containing protein [Candidatus Kerfeldbacteria bacterium]
MPQIDINVWAVLLSTVIFMVIGSVWYSPKVFYNTWIKANGLDEEKIKTGSPMKSMGGMFVGAFITSYILAHVVGYAQANTFVEGLQTGFWMWLGFIGAVTISEVLFAQRSWKVWGITNGYNLIALLCAGVILALWK